MPHNVRSFTRARIFLARLLCPAIALLVAGGINAASVDPSMPATPATAVTFSKHIAPLIYANCSTCHHEGETAPFTLMGYDDARKHAKQMVKVTSSGLMPPWKAEHGFGDFLGERRLNPQQITLLKQWFVAGCPEGDPASAPSAPKYTTGWQLGPPDLIVQMPEAYTVPAEGRDVYRCFILPVNIPAGKYVKAVEFRPRNRRIVHHAVISALDPAQAAKLQKTEIDGQIGFRTGLTAPGVRLPGSLGIWAPGHDVVPLPEGYTVNWPKGWVISMQLHLNPSGKPEKEQSSIGLYFTDNAPVGQLQNATLMNKNIVIQPGDAAFHITSSLTMPYSAEVIGLFPHMHLIGKECRATATLLDGTTQPLIWIKDWDFSWQTYYSFAKPLHLPAGTRIDASFTYDNSAANPRQPSNPPRTVLYGEQTADEMAVLILDAIPSDPIAAAIAKRVHPKTVDGKAPAPATAECRARARAIIAEFDKDHDGKLTLEEMIASKLASPTDLATGIKRFDKDTDGKIDEDELTTALIELSKKPETK